MTIEELKIFCKKDGRICPRPKHWSRLFEMLKNTTQKPGGGFIPSAPLILAAWDSPALYKQLRLAEHLDWAESQNQLQEIEQFLFSLSEQDWYHIND